MVLRRAEPHATVQATGVEDYIHNLQYPQTGRTSCNTKNDEQPNHAAHKLAVPSDGSNLMQRPVCDSKDKSGDLAVPSDGSNLMQRGYRSRGRRQACTCSTLRRVEPHATWTAADTAWFVTNLQYPQTGRTSCNFACNVRKRYDPDLQYPQTGRTSCNRTGDHAHKHTTALAVPSDGSNLMQPYRHALAYDCNHHLAVPSDGSNLMQHAARCLIQCVGGPLAVPSDGSNLMQLVARYGCQSRRIGLQYPQTGRT